MPKQGTYILMQNAYPFTQTRHANESGVPVQVKKVVEYDAQPRFIIKEKIRMLKSFGFHNLIGVQSTISQQNAIILFFQCVPYQFLKESCTLSQQKISKIYNQMLELCECLASKFIVHDLDVSRVGLDKRFNLKYFLGVDFRIDKNIDRGKKKKSYVSQVNDFFLKACAKSVNIQNRVQINTQQNGQKLPSFHRINDNESKFQLNVKKILNLDPNRQRRILKKSSILQSKQGQMKVLNASNRFTFNNDNRIQLPIHQKPDQTIQRYPFHKPLKMEELSLRIDKLKSYMKELTGKMQRHNVSPIHMDKHENKDNNLALHVHKHQHKSNSHSPQQARKLTPNKFTNFQKKIAQLRTSKLALTSNNAQNSRNSDNQSSDLRPKCNQGKKIQVPKQSPTENIRSHEKKPIKPIEITNHPAINSDELSKNNILNLPDEDRQHKEYLTLANNDKYCEQFMNFLEDNFDPSLTSSIQHTKAEQTIRVSSPFQQPEEPPRKRNALLRQNLKTQSSQNALQIQNRVQKVIRSSLKLINGLRSRQTIRCE